VAADITKIDLHGNNENQKALLPKAPLTKQEYPTTPFPEIAQYNYN